MLKSFGGAVAVAILRENTDPIGRDTCLVNRGINRQGTVSIH